MLEVESPDLRSANDARKLIMLEDPRAPAMLMTWAPDYVPSTDEARDPGWIPCNKATPPDARGVVYEHTTKGGRGIVAVCDFGSSTGVPHPTFRYAGWAALTLLECPISRERLLADPILAPTFRNLQGPPRPLAVEQGHALQHLIGDGPPRRVPRPPTAKERRSVLTDPWRPDGVLGEWVTEAEMENHIASDPRAWRMLGFSSQPTTQHPLNRKDRPDLLGEDVVAEIKLKANANDIRQLHRYMHWLDANDPLPDGRDWRGLLITNADRADPALLAAVVAARPAVELWSCQRRLTRKGLRIRGLAATSA